MISSLLNDRYLIEAELGRGGMGIVYSGRDTLLYRDIAVKVLLSTGLGTEGQARLLREARAAAGLNHPGIVSVYDVGVLEPEVGERATGFIVMELVKGETLARRKPDTFEEILEIVDQVCAALDHAHHQGVIHRDLKPENIAITPEKQVKLMDFGLAKTTADRSLEESTGISGSLPYIAPEVILGQQASEQGDLFALGVIFYELVAGRLPFEGDDLAAVLTQMLHSPAIPPSTYDDRIPPLADALILRLLRKSPKNRPDSAEEVRLQIEQIRQSQPGSSFAEIAGPGVLDRLVRGRLIGRKADLAGLVDMWRQSMAGVGHFVLVSGEPGIGKSRLLQELAGYANISGGDVIKGACFAGSGMPYMPFTEIIATALSGRPDPALPKEVLAELLAIAPEMRLHYPQIKTSLPAVSGADQQRLFEAVVLLLVAHSLSGPLLLIIDDLHWADSGTLALLQHLSRRVRQRPIMIAGTYREVDLTDDRPTKLYLDRFYQERLARRIKLSRLDFWETRELLATLFTSSVSEPFARNIFQETEGNPFFIEEVCKALIDSGRLTFEAGSWQYAGIGPFEIPQGVRLAIQSRVDRLSDREQNVLQSAALLGREFEYDLLRSIVSLDEEQLIDILTTTISVQLIEEVPQRIHPGPETQLAKRRLSFSFTHALIHTTLLESLGTLGRQRRQLRVAQALEAAFPERQQLMAPLLGRYFAEAGAGEKAIYYLLKSGDAARDVFAYDEAIKAYCQALMFLEELDDSARTARTFMKLGLAYHNTFKFEKASQAYEQGFDLWQHAPAGVDSPKLPPPQTLFTHIFSLPTIDPSRSMHLSGSKIIHQLFAGLVEMGSNQEIIPGIARRWQMLDGGRRYLFYLREDICWSDGQPLTAHDFVYAWRRALDPTSGEFPADLLYDVQGARAYHRGGVKDPTVIGVKALGDWTLAIELEGPTSYFLHLLTQFVAMPLPRHIIEQWGERWTDPAHIVSNGPFLLESWRPGEQLTLIPNQLYRGRVSGNVARVHIRYLSDPGVAQAHYQNGELDCLELTPLFSPKALKLTHRQFPDEYFSGPTPSVSFLAFNLARPPFDNPQIRLAFASATDRSQIANVALDGLYRPASGGFIPPGIPGHSPGLGIAYHPEQAAKLLAEVGHPGGVGLPELVVRVSGGAIYAAISETLQNMWKENLGVEVSFAPLSPGAKCHLTLASVVPEYPDPDGYLRVNSWGPVTGWRNETFSRLVDEARRVPDWEERITMYRQAEHLLIGELSLFPLTYGRFHSLLKPWVKNYPLNPLAIPIWKDVLIEDRRDKEPV